MNLFTYNILKKVLEKSNYKLVLNKRTYERYRRQIDTLAICHWKNMNLLKSKKMAD